MSSISSATSSSTNSTSSFVSSLVFNLAIFGAELVAFTILRPHFRYVYEPRSLSVLASKRQPSLTSSIILWPWAVWKADYRKIKEVNGMDSYFFVRFLRMLVRIFLPIWIISWVVLLPATSVNTGVSNHSGLDRFTFGNVATNAEQRYAAHLILAWGFTFWIWYNIKKEMHHFVRTRQRFLISPAHSSSYQASTILITGIPLKYLSESAIIKLFSHLPGGVRKVWLNRDLKDMPDLYNRRLKALAKLESAETNLLNTATKRHNKNLKKAAKEAKKNGGSGNVDTSSAIGLNAEDPEAAKSLAERLVPAKKRPSHRLPLFSWMPFALPLVGKKVDSIEWAREEVRTTTAELTEKRAQLEKDVQLTTMNEAKYKERDNQIRAGKFNINVPNVPISLPMGGSKAAADFSDQTYPPVNGAFVLFNKQIAAHMAAQTLSHHDPYRMANQSKWIEVAPDDVIWENLGMNPYERRIRMAISWALTIGLIIVWAIPVAFVGAVSNISSLSQKYHWLSWLGDLPTTVVGIIQGILPSVLLAVLFMLLPIVLRLLARFEGIPKRTGVELSLMTRFFIFEVIHGFLVVTVSSGIIAALPQLVSNPTSVPSLLASQLPLASTFFLTYVLLQGLSGTAGAFLQIVSLILYYVKLFLLGSTPRSVYNIKYGGSTVAWGTLFPQTSLIMVIALGYSIISPIINGLACVTFFLFYMLYKYLFLWVKEMPASGDTGGLFYPKAMQHIFVGLYIQQICLCALFFLAQNDQGHPGAVVEGALMVVLIVFTAFFHNTINNSYGPLIEYLPLSLADRSFGHDERAAAIAAAKAEADASAATQKVPIDEGVKATDFADAKNGSTVQENAYPPRPSPRASMIGSPRITGPSIDAQTDDLSNGGSRVPSPAPDPTAQAIAEDEGPTDFRHPAATEAQRIVWLPRDTLGVIEEEEKGLKEFGIQYSTAGAEMDAKGHVQIGMAPPEEEMEGQRIMRGRSAETDRYDEEYDEDFSPKGASNVKEVGAGEIKGEGDGEGPSRADAKKET